MAFDLVTQMQGPTIPINLYSEAASAGARTGNAVPTPLTSILKGVVEGIQTGQDIAVKQEQINQFPAQRAQAAATLEATQLQNVQRAQDITAFPQEQQIREEQLEAQRTQNEINALNLEIAQNTQKETQAAKLETLREQASKAKQAAADRELGNQLSADLNSADPFVRKNILSNPKYTDYMLRNADIADRVLGRLSFNGDLSPEETQRAFQINNMAKERQYQFELQKADIAAKQKILAQGDKIVDNFINSPIYKDQYAEIGNIFRAADELQVYRKGTKNFATDGKTIDKAKPDREIEAGEISENKFTLFRNDVRIADDLSEKQAAELTDLQGYLRTFEEQARQRAGMQRGEQQPPSTSPRTTQTVAGLETALERQGLPIEQTGPILERGVERGKAASESMLFALKRDVLQAFPFLDTNEVDQAVQQNVVESKSATEVREVLSKSAANLAQKTLEKLNTGSLEERQALRDWGKDNEVPLTYAGLKSYYAANLQTALSSAYEQAYEIGVAEKAAANKRENAVAAADELASLSGKTPEQALRSRTSLQPKAAALPNQNIPSNAAQISKAATGLHEFLSAEKAADKTATATDLSPKATRAVKKTISATLTNPYLQGEPSYVKAIAAVESAGGQNLLSPTGVVGIMQISKAAASEFPELNRENPEDNVVMGRLYIERLLNDFNGNKALAYAAYNAGAGTIKRAQELAGGSEDWNVVKRYLLQALWDMYKKGRIRVHPTEKYKEAYPYPDKVLAYEGMLSDYA